MDANGKEILRLHGIIDQLKDALRHYNIAADKFIRKVEAGRARSVETYADLKACRENAQPGVATGKGE